MLRGHHPERWNEGYGGMLIGVACILLFCSLVLMVVGFATPYWIERDTTDGTNTVTIYRGLWQHCTKVGDADAECDMTIDTSEETWYRVCQGMAILALVALVFCFVFFLYWSCSNSRYYFNKVLILCILILAGVLAIATSVVYGIEFDDEFEDYDLDWSFYCYVVSGPLIILAVPFIMLVPSFVLQPTWQGPWYRRFNAPRYAAPAARPPVMIPAVAPANVIPKPAPLVPAALVPQNAYQPPRPAVVQQPQTRGNNRTGGGGFSWVRNS